MEKDVDFGISFFFFLRIWRNGYLSFEDNSASTAAAAAAAMVLAERGVLVIILGVGVVVVDFSRASSLFIL